MAETGRSAWTTVGKDNGEIYYKFTKNKPLDGSTPEKGDAYLCVHGGVRAIQERLLQLGYGDSLKKPFNEEKFGVYNRQTKRMVLAFQKDIFPATYHSGLVGATTAKNLFGPYISTVNKKHAQYIFGIGYAESGFDPGAQGYTTPGDIGLYQINTLVHTDFDINTATDYVETTDWVARRFANAWKKYAGKGEQLRINCSIAQHNAPAWAASWYSTGEPPNEKIEDYVERVRTFAATYSRLAAW